jgi:hypothetical protein
MIKKIKRKPKVVRSVRLRQEDIDTVQRLANKHAEGNFNAMIEQMIRQQISA